MPTFIFYFNQSKKGNIHDYITQLCEFSSKNILYLQKLKRLAEIIINPQLYTERLMKENLYLDYDAFLRSIKRNTDVPHEK